MERQNNVSAAIETQEGEGVVVKRLFPVRREMMNFDPFVLWDHFELTPGSGFPQHPHRGFEAITYLFEGGVEHKDNLNNASTVFSGGAQRFTAGKGILHSEMPVKGAVSRGIQVWINLPRHLKQMVPDYQQVDEQDLPSELIDGVRVRTIVGTEESIRLQTSVQYLELSFLEATRHTVNVSPSHRGFVYVVDGDVKVDNQLLEKGQACFFEQLTTELIIEGAQDAHVMVISGVPHKQPIYQHGPYVD